MLGFLWRERVRKKGGRERERERDGGERHRERGSEWERERETVNGGVKERERGGGIGSFPFSRPPIGPVEHL